MTPSRPLTHDLFKSFFETFSITLQEVLIYNLIDGIFYAKIICSDGNQQVEIDARTSDAVALAVRFDCPIYTYEFIMSSAGIVIESNDFAFLENIDQVENKEPSTPEPLKKPKKATHSPYRKLTDEQLENSLRQAIEKEQYETAAELRDEISRRKA